MSRKNKDGIDALREALAEQPAQQTCNCRWEDEVQVQQCTLHEAHVDAIHEWAGRAKAAEAKLKEQPAQQEPVAFLVDGDLYYPEEIDWETLQEQGHTVASLYTSPPAQQQSCYCPNCEALSKELAELKAQQEPVAWRVKWPAIGGGYKWLMVDRPLMEKEGFENETLYTSPPAQRKPLSDDEIGELMKQTWGCASIAPRHAPAFARAIEAAHGIKENT